jgi:phage FluMu protein Com
MTIEFSCPACAQQIRTPDTTAGKRGKCPSCAAIVRIPAAGDASTTPVAKAPAVKPTAPPTANEVAETGPIEFFCSLCGQLVRTPRAAAGKKGKCPHCQGVMQIPLKSRAAKATLQTTPQSATSSNAHVGLTPRRSPTSQPKPAEDLGLAPLDDLDGLAPLPEAKPEPKPQSRPAARSKPAPKTDDDDGRELRLQSNVPLAPLTPLDSGSGNAMSGLAPLNNDLFGGTDPLATANAGLAGGDLFGGAPLGGDPFGGSNNAFGSPAATSLAPATYSSPSHAPANVPGKPDSIFIVLPAIFQLLAILPFFLGNGFMVVSTAILLLFAMLSPTNNPDAAAKGIGLILAYEAVQIIGLAAQFWIVLGSVQMMLLRKYDNATSAAWLSCFPCIGFLGFPFGIWSLIVLQTPKFQRMFRD